LTEAKEIVGHGHFGSWLEQEFGWTDRTARNFISVYELSESKSENFSDLNLPVSGLYLLAAPTTPEQARTEIIERAKSGEAISTAEIKDVVENARATSEHRVGFRERKRSPEQVAKHNRERFEATISHIRVAAQTTEDMPIPETVTEEEIAGAVEELLVSQAQIDSLIVRLDPSIQDRDDIGASSAAELARLNARIEELQNEKRRLEIQADGLRSEINQLKAERSPAPHALVERALRCASVEQLIGALTDKLADADGAMIAAADQLRSLHQLRSALWNAATPPSAEANANSSDGFEIPPFLRRTNLADARECVSALSSRGGSNGA
jgi:hypothetical protein